MPRDQPGPFRALSRLFTVAGAVLIGACSNVGRPTPTSAGNPPAPPSILFVTLDTTRADAIGPEAHGVETAAFNALAARGRRFRQAWATVPETLPSHVSMMTGLYPGGHRVHENGRFLDSTYPVIAERLKAAGYHTEAFVSAFALARRFGLARGFDLYDDEQGAGQSERTARDTTDAVVARLGRGPAAPLFLWVHYYDPHAPYMPPEPFRARYTKQPYLGEVASMDEQLGRLVRAFEEKVAGPKAIVVAGDHGEGLGEHGEPQHGYLLYRSTLQVPLVVVGPDVAPGVSDLPVSTRRVFHTILDLAGIDASNSLRRDATDPVLGEAMKPFLEFGWQPQVMAMDGTRQAILTGRLEVYDLAADPGETHDIAGAVRLPPALNRTLEEYPVPGPEAAIEVEALGDEARQKLASLGYVSAGAAPVVRKGAPRPADMTRLFEPIERASSLFVAGRYAQAIPLLERIAAEDRFNLDATLRLATSHSMLGHDALAVETFRKAAAIAPQSLDVPLYLGLHYARGREWADAAPILERVLATSPERLAALEALATIRERQGRAADAMALRQRAYALRTPTPAELVRLGEQAMGVEATPIAIDAFEKARALEGGSFAHDLELGVLYLAARRLPEAAAALDRVPSTHPDYAMALFKRAQVSVLLREPDRAARIATARERADSTTRALIANERLFGDARN